MKNVRIWFTKLGSAKYISHLDLNRCMLRAVRRAELPIWYTEGFNPHPFVTFPLPISLGISGERECMDIRIVDESYDISQIPDRMNKYLPEGIKVFDATYPRLDPKFIAFASYSADISVDGMTAEELYNEICSITSTDSLPIEKKTKAGMKRVDMLPYLKNAELTKPTESDTELHLKVTLPAGNIKNVGLPLVFKAIERRLSAEINYSIVKHNMFTEEMTVFE